MPRLPSDRVPKYGLHRQSGQARVVLNGRHFLLGPHGSKASHAEYDRLIAEWVANGRQAPAGGTGDMTVSTLILRFWEHAKTYYAGGGELHNFRDALRPLRRLYGATPARDFGPLALKAVRAEMLKARKVTDSKSMEEKTLPGWCRNVANRHVARIKHVFKWATENELVPPSVYHALSAVAGLRRGRSEARETEPVRPAPLADVEAALAHVSPQVKAMVQLQLLTGARGGELRRMRTCDVDTGGSVWVYRPDGHKTAHHGHTREIRLGPKAIAVLAPFLKPDLQAPVFSPADAEASRRERRRQDRKTPVQPSQVKRAEETRRLADGRKRRPGDRYTGESYRKAIVRACAKAGVPAWHPHQLRHNAATNLRRLYGLEAARAVLGQKSGAVTEIYAEIDAATVERIMGEVG